jgi:ribosomal protein S18 acetylase RimI-like enzyme
VTPYTLRPIAPSDKPEVRRLLTESWGAATVDALAVDRMIDASALPGWLAEDNQTIIGLLTYLVTGDLLDVITINAYRAGLGIGAALLAQLDAPRIRVVTTEDNTHALNFYQRNGFRPTRTPHPRGVELIKSR